MSKITRFVPFAKKDAKERMVYGYATTESLDSQGEVVKLDAVKDALPDYMKYGNVREMHQPSAVGKTKEATADSKGLYIGVKVVDDAAWAKVEEGVYNGFSIGGSVTAKVDNEITEITLKEISLVDRPANPDAVFDVIKADNLAETTGEKADIEKATEVEVKEDVAPVATQEVEVKAEEEKGALQVAEEEAAAAEPAEEKAEEPAEEAKTDEPAEEPKEEAPVKEEKKKADEPENMKKSVWTADWMIDLACSVMYAIESFKYQEKDTAELEVALSNLKAIAGRELNEDDFTKEEIDKVDAVVALVDLHKAAVADGKIRSELRMPSVDQIASELEKQGVPVNAQTIAGAQEMIAGKMIEKLQKMQQETLNQDAAMSEAAKELKAAGDSLVAQLKKESGHQEMHPFVHYIMKKNDDVQVEEAATASEEVEAPATEEVEAPTEKVDTNFKSNDQADLAKMAGELQKAQDSLAKAMEKISSLESKVKELEKTEVKLPIYGSAVLVDRFAKADGETSEEDKTALLSKMTEVGDQLKANPFNAEIRKQAEELAAQYQRLSRQTI